MFTAIISLWSLQIACKVKEYFQVTIGDFIYAKIENKVNDEMVLHYEVIDLSESGKLKETVVFYKWVNGVKAIYNDGHRGGWSCNNEIDSNFSSKALKKLLFEDCSIETEKEKNSLYGLNFNNVLFDVNKIGVKYKAIVNYGDFSKCAYQSNISTIYMRKNVFEENIADFVESKKQQSDFDLNKIINYFRPANVEFHWNYENSPQEDYYWIDDIENGELIEEIPPIPEREGYSFGGWYTEKECINEFSFSTPISKMDINWEELLNSRQQVPDEYVTSLYAKWLKL